MRYYRKKPDLQALYAQKEAEKLERGAEMEECRLLVKKCLNQMKQVLDADPTDVDEIRKTADFCVAWFRKRVEERKFKRLGKFDIDFIWETEVKQIQRLYGLKKI